MSGLGDPTSSALRSRLAPVVLIMVTFALAGGVDRAAGATFCVAPTHVDGCVTSFKDALEAAKDRDGADEIVLRAGEFTDGPFCYMAPDQLRIRGAGASSTVLTMSPGAASCEPATPPAVPPPPAVLTLDNLNSLDDRLHLSDVGIRIPASTGSRGLVLGGAFADDVEVTSVPAGVVGPVGVVTRGTDATFTSGSIALPVEDSVGILATTLAATIARTHINAVTGVLTNGSLIISSSVFEIEDVPSPGGVPAGLAATATSRDTTVFGRHLTIYGTGRGDDNGVILIAGPNRKGVVDIGYSVLDNVGTSLRRLGNGDARITGLVSHYPRSFYDDRAFGGTGTGGIFERDHVTFAEPPGFVSPATGVFRLEEGSPLIDAGDSSPLLNYEPPLDLGGKPRILDGTIDSGDEGCEPIRDLGAYEFVPSHLLARANVASDVVAGLPASFDASASCDPDSNASLAYRWTFDDGGTAGGARVAHTFSTPGLHEATVRVTSSSDRTAEVKVSVLVLQAPPTGIGAAPAEAKVKALADSESPRARRLDVRPVAFRAAGAGASIARSVGAFVRYRLSEPAKMRFTLERVERRRIGRKRVVRLGGSFTHEGRSGSNKFRFTGRLTGKKLRPGTYRLLAAPADAAGNRGATVRAQFRIVRR